MTVPLHGKEEDSLRRFNRTETSVLSLLAILIFKAVPRRNDRESINRSVDDSPCLRPAHGVGHARHHVNLIGYALMVNSRAGNQSHSRAPDRTLTA